MNGSEAQESTGTAKIIYILYLAGFVTSGITNLIGLVMAYVNQKDASGWLKSHYQFQIRTFWIGFLYSVIGVILIFVFIGWIVILFNIIWLIIRCIKGMKSLDQQQAYPNPTSWMF